MIAFFKNVLGALSYPAISTGIPFQQSREGMQSPYSPDTAIAQYYSAMAALKMNARKTKKPSRRKWLTRHASHG